MSCCSPTEPVSKSVFLEQKLRNFRTFVEPHCSSDAMRESLKQYESVDAVMPFLLQTLAAERMGQTEALLDKFCDAFTLDAEALPPFRAKVKRYIDMFREVLTA